MKQKYDVIIIGAGMSAMAAGIRLAMFDKSVLILEKHAIPGGLNSYYARQGRQFDVGLHAMTNFVPKGTRAAPLSKLLKQLRIPYEQLQISEQKHSKIVFPEHELTFTNQVEDLLDEVNRLFPDQIDAFRALLTKIDQFNETALENDFLPAKEVVGRFIKDECLLEMIFCPLLIYGSAWENDMDFSQFVIMFKSIFLEGFMRPKGGVRTIIKLLTEKLDQLGCEVRYRSGVAGIISKDARVCGVETDSGEIIEAPLVLSSAGLPETMNMVTDHGYRPRIGKMSFTESILVSDKKPADFGVDSSIIFYNQRPRYLYRRPAELYDAHSAVVCFPNNFQHDDYDEGWYRITNMANFEKWSELPKALYRQKKEELFVSTQNILKTLIPNFDAPVIAKDVFSPTTVKKYTGRLAGTVYGSPDKSRDGRTPIENLCVMGTDQGFLGIVGAMLSGISMANLHGLMEGRQ